MTFACCFIFQNEAFGQYTCVAPSGQTLYFVISGGHTAYLTYPGYYWSGYTKPTGNLIIPDSIIYEGNYYYITMIARAAFKNCWGLTSVTFPKHLVTISDSAFVGCSGLTSITIPSSVTQIGKSAFRACSQLATVNFNAINCYVPVGQNQIGAPFKNCNSLTTVNFGDSVFIVPTRIFQYCSNLTTINFNSVPHIDTESFGYCTSLTSITLPDSIQSIGSWAFKGCSSLVEIISISETPPTIDYDPFNSFMNVPCNAIIRIPCGSQTAYSSQWSYFSNFVEEFGFSIISQSADNTMGTAIVSTQPTCTSSTAVVSATAYNGFHFSHWNDGDTLNPRTITVTSDTVLTAFFAQNTPIYNVTVNSNNTTMGTVSGGGTYEEGTTITLTATANNGYHFDHWSDGNTQNPRTITVNGNITLTAYFVQNTQTYTVTVNSNNTTMGTVTGGGTYEQGTAVQISAIPNNGYHFDHWSDGNTQNPRTITVNSNITLTAYFVQNTQYHTVTLSSNDYSMGTVTGGGQYEHGSTVTCAAVPYNGYHFERWSDNNTQNPRNIIVNNDISLTAYFAANAEIDDIDDAGIIVYAKDYQIHIDEAIGETVTIYTIDGRTVASLPISTEHIAIPVNKTGVYIVKIGNHPAHKVVVR